MAYARRRFSRRTRRPRRSYGRRKSTRTYRRPTRPKRTSKRYILNTASRRMSDKMNAFSDIIDNDPTGTYVNSGALFAGPGDGTRAVIWNASARIAENSVGDKLYPLAVGRHRSTIFFKGIKERVQIKTNSSAPWEWRRIVFSVKTNLFGDSFDPATALYWRRTGDGYKRMIADAPLVTLYGRIFKGADQSDWIDPQIAALDRDRITVHYDKKRTINAGSAGGVTRHFPIWHGFNKNFKYDDVEDGGNIGTSPFCSEGKYGLGNVYIVDLFACGLGSGAEDELEFTPSTTMYWHEK